MKVIIAGTRTFQVDSESIQKFVDHSHWEINELVCGMASGVDLSGKIWADEKGIPVQKFHPDWVTLKRSAGVLRNAQMAEYADGLIAIWDGSSSGTRDMIAQMQKLHKPVIIFTPLKQSGQWAVAQG